jgi:putative hydrolase of the HAD superfamily
VVAFDADDTLWHTETHYRETQTRLAEILDNYAPHEQVQNQLDAIERKNIKLFGYGIKGFTLSMVEAAIEISGGHISAGDIHEIIALGKAMLDAPMEIMPGVEDVLLELATVHRLMLITKGDMLDQTNKIETSGLADYFERIEIVTEKDADVYAGIFSQHGVEPTVAMMVGNSLPSDILPVLEIGGYGVHIPYAVTASFEQHPHPVDHPRFHELREIALLPSLLNSL